MNPADVEAELLLECVSEDSEEDIDKKLWHISWSLKNYNFGFK